MNIFRMWCDECFIRTITTTLFPVKTLHEFKTDALTSFNKDIESATVVVMNEADNDKRHEHIQASFWIKENPHRTKGVDPYYVDNTAWYWLMTNDSLASGSARARR
ncbi:hypothetical protein O9992_28500 [Vibrio lentus]|nr:hypothetical protein [Vibrio lentus]